MNIMRYKGFKAKIMEADRLLGEDTHELPPGKPLEIFSSEVFINYPENWMVGSDVFVVPVRPNKGLWFDWRENDVYNTAILPTVKGCNPLTGLQTSGFHLERYEEKCPKHKCNFIAERFCPKCGYRWPPQNYISYPNILWWDTWVTNEGVGRQFFFTADELRDIASHKIGKNAVPAFGFTFFTPKERRESPKAVPYRGVDSAFLNSDGYGNGFKAVLDEIGGTEEKTSGGMNIFYHSVYQSIGQTYSSSLPYDCATNDSVKGLSLTNSGGIITPNNISMEGGEINSPKPQKEEIKEVSIGAGARIRQSLNRDTYPLESWKEAPDASMTIYFIFQEKFEELKSKGMRDISSAKEGMLQGLPVG